MERIHTFKGESPYTNFLFVHNAQMVIEKTDAGEVIIRTDFIASEKPERGISAPFSIAGVIDYEQEVIDFKALFEEVGVGSP